MPATDDGKQTLTQDGCSDSFLRPNAGTQECMAGARGTDGSGEETKQCTESIRSDRQTDRQARTWALHSTSNPNRSSSSSSSRQRRFDMSLSFSRRNQRPTDRRTVRSTSSMFTFHSAVFALCYIIQAGCVDLMNQADGRQQTCRISFSRTLILLGALY